MEYSYRTTGRVRVVVRVCFQLHVSPQAGGESFTISVTVQLYRYILRLIVRYSTVYNNS